MTENDLTGIKRIKLSELRPDARNANLGTERGLQALDDSLRHLGAGRSILVDKNGVIIAGNKTAERAQDIGLSEVILVPTDGTQLVAVVRTDLDIDHDPRARRLALADNRVGELDLSWDPQTLLALSNEYGAEVKAGLWTADEWQKSVLREVNNTIKNDADNRADDGELTALLDKWHVERGQLWLVPSDNNPGEHHRIYCGDSSAKADVERATGGELANLLFTSPPYWLGLAYETQKSESEIDAFIKACTQAWTDSVNVSYGRIVINTGTAAIHRVEKKRKLEVLPLIDKWQAALRQRGWLLRHMRIWSKIGPLAKASIAPRSDVVDQYWDYFIEFDHDSSEYETLAAFWAPSGQQRGQERTDQPWAQLGVWSDIQGEASAEGKHVVAFPVEVPRRYILLYSQPGELILEPFLGSGTTLIAAEMTGRLTASLELSPKFLAGALERIEQYGLKPRLAVTK